MVSPSPHIWIVDDDTDDQYLFEQAFITLIPPISIRSLYDGAELVPALEQSETLPDLILLDLNMPRLNGFEALQRLWAEPLFQTLPVVVLSTSSVGQDQERALQLGANGFLTKPPTMDQILSLFGQLVQEWHLS